jgi:AcrR family transcriptional regulator
VSQRTQPRSRPNRAQKREANRERILTAARTVFGARGYQAATIEQIADEAGLSNGAIYYNFGSKEDLFLALLDARMEARLVHARKALGVDGNPSTGGRGLEAEARDITRAFKESREWRLLLLEFVAYAARNPDFGAHLREHKRRLRETLAGILRGHMEAAGIVPPMAIDRVATAITALLNGLAIEELASPGAVPDDLFGDVLALLLPDPRPAPAG